MSFFFSFHFNKVFRYNPDFPKTVGSSVLTVRNAVVVFIFSKFYESFVAIASLAQSLACSPQVWYIMGSSSGRVNAKTMKLVFVASPLST
jgi:hypothetical protein